MATPAKPVPVRRLVEIDLKPGSENGFNYQDENGNPGNSVHVPQGGTIQWRSKVGNGNFAVHFDRGRTPCNQVDFWGSGSFTGNILTTAASDTYKYIVAVQDANGRIHIDDPEVIVP